MAILKSKGNNIRNEIKAKVKDIDYKKVLESEIIENNKTQLLGYSTGSSKEVYKYILNILENNNGELKNHLKSLIDELIPDSTVNVIEEFIRIKAINDKIENEIRSLKYKINSLGNSVDDSIEKFKLEIELKGKEDELIENKKRYIEVYTQSINNTLISEDLYQIFREVEDINMKVKEDCDKEIELMKAKTQVLREIYKNFNIVREMNLMIEERVNRCINSETIIKTSKEGVPLIQALVK